MTACMNSVKTGSAADCGACCGVFSSDNMSVSIFTGIAAAVSFFVILDIRVMGLLIIMGLLAALIIRKQTQPTP